MTLRVHLDGDTIADVSYEGMGCSISQASVSAMYDLVIGKTVPEALETGGPAKTWEARGEGASGIAAGRMSVFSSENMATTNCVIFLSLTMTTSEHVMPHRKRVAHASR